MRVCNGALIISNAFVKDRNSCTYRMKFLIQASLGQVSCENSHFGRQKYQCNVKFLGSVILRIYYQDVAYKTLKWLPFVFPFFKKIPEIPCNEEAAWILIWYVVLIPFHSVKFSTFVKHFLCQQDGYFKMGSCLTRCQHSQFSYVW